MAETAKLLSPQKEVLIPSSFNGCSLADSISANDIRQLKQNIQIIHLLLHQYICICKRNVTYV